MGNVSIKDDIREWWATAPMTYGDVHGDAEYVRPDGTIERADIGTRRFFELADERFYSWNTPLHDDGIPFSKIFDYERYSGRDVIEVGCGMGCMAMNWAARGARITAVDLNPIAVQQTRSRFGVFGIEGEFMEADGEDLPFDDDSFDYAYSWGVLHHSPAPKQSIAELYRVLKPGCSVGVMLYHRHSILYRYTIAFIEGFLNMERLFLDEVELASRYGDGAREEGNPHTWPVTREEIHQDLFAQFEDVRIRLLGTDVPTILNTWRHDLAAKVSHPVLERLSSRAGWSLWITGTKRA